MKQYIECYKCGAENECDCPDDLRTENEALREALLDLFYASGDVSVSGQKDSVNAFLEARKQALASAGSGKK